VILVVNHGRAQAQSLKQLIEFMDTPDVRTATPGQWRDCLGNAPLDALFVGVDLSDDDVRELLDDVSAENPDVPIVMMHEDHER